MVRRPLDFSQDLYYLNPFGLGWVSGTGSRSIPTDPYVLTHAHIPPSHAWPPKVVPSPSELLPIGITMSCLWAILA